MLSKYVLHLSKINRKADLVYNFGLEVIPFQMACMICNGKIIYNL